MSVVLLNDFLSTEITFVPTWLRTVLKGHYNNTLCNGATWVLVCWKILHIIYNKIIDGYFKRIGTKQYLRDRITSSLWYCAFFSSFLTYYLLTFEGATIDLLKNAHKIHTDDISMSLLVSYTILCTFYMHSALTEGIQNGLAHLFVKFTALATVCISAYVLGLSQIPFTLSAVVGIPAVSEELTKIFFSLISRNSLNCMFVKILYVFNLALCTFIHLLVVPLFFLIPLGKTLFSRASDLVLLLLVSSLLVWLGAALYQSLLSNSIIHWLFHNHDSSLEQSTKEEDIEKTDDKRKIVYCMHVVLCSFFPARTDAAYVLNVLNSDVKRRKLEMEAKKKPKNRAMIVQTLKCMMVIKKTLRQKKKRDTSKLEEPLENDDNTEYEFALEEDNPPPNEEVDSKEDSGEADDETKDNPPRNKELVSKEDGGEGHGKTEDNPPPNEELNSKEDGHGVTESTTLELAVEEPTEVVEAVACACKGEATDWCAKCLEERQPGGN